MRTIQGAVSVVMFTLCGRHCMGLKNCSQLLTVQFVFCGSGLDATQDNILGAILREVCNNKARQGPPLLCVWNVCPQGRPQLFLDYYKTFFCRWTTTVRGWTIVWPSTTTSFSSFSWCMDSSIAFMSPLQVWNIFFRYLFPYLCTLISQYSCYCILINAPEFSQPL